jgi:hypothetical protein
MHFFSQLLTKKEAACVVDNEGDALVRQKER